MGILYECLYSFIKYDLFYEVSEIVKWFVCCVCVLYEMFWIDTFCFTFSVCFLFFFFVRGFLNEKTVDTNKTKAKNK